MMGENYSTLCQNSCIEREFKTYLKDEHIEFISFDIFDTLLFRDVSNPSDIFNRVGSDEYVKKIFLNCETFTMFRKKAENKARKASIEEEVTLNEIYAQLDLSFEEQQTIKAIEFKEEKKSLYINKQIKNWIVKAIKNQKKVVLISDIYFTDKEMGTLLEGELELSEIECFLSSMYRKTKSKKSLYQYVQQEKEVTYEQWLHVGDNIISDVNNAASLGIKTIHYSINKPLREQFLLERAFVNENIGVLDGLRKMTSINCPYDNEENEFYYNYGATVFGPLLRDFSLWLEKVAQQYNLNQINFIMREGKTFEKYFNKLCPHVSTNLIYASRKSTFLASLPDDFNIQEFNFYNYRKLTIEDFHTLFEIDMNEVLLCNKSTKFEDANLIYVDEMNLLEHCIRSFNNQEHRVKELIKKEKSTFKEYLLSLGIQKSSMLVDFGGTGTISMRITDIMKDKVVLNSLFYMHDIGHFHTLPHKTLSFLPSTNKTKKALEIIRRTPEFIEILLNGLEETTTRYIKKEDTIDIETHFPHSHKDVLVNKIEAFHMGIANYFIVADEYGLKTQNTEILTLLLSRGIDIPTLSEVKYFGRLHYDEGKGAGLVDQLITREKTESLMNIGVEKAYRNFQNDLFYKRNEFHWLQGVITKVDSTYISSMKGLKKANNNDEAITSILEVLDLNSHIKAVNIYGAGEFFLQLLPHLEERKIVVNSVIDRKAQLSEFEYLGYRVKSIDKCINLQNLAPIIVTSKVFAVDITDMLFKYVMDKQLKVSVINYYNGLSEVTFKE